MAASMTYSSLLEDLQMYAERTDTDYVDQCPRFVMQAENRIAAEARGLGFMRSITDDLTAGSPVLDKPDRWRETVSFQIGTGTLYNTRKFLLERTYEFCRTYAPDDTSTGEPSFYGDWDYHHWIIVKTPSLAYPYEIIYHERPQPLDSTNTTNWTTEYAPQLILYAALLEAQAFLKRDDRLKVFQDGYDRAIKQVEFEQQRRMMDRSARAGG